MADIERFTDEPQPQRSERQDTEFERRLREFGVPYSGVQLLVSRFYDKRSYKEICEEFHFVDENAARYYLRVLLRELKRKGFRFTDEAA